MLAIHEYQRQHGEYPESLDDLLPLMGRLPRDYGDGGVLRYRRTDDGYLLYSVGEDGRDDTPGSIACDQTGGYPCPDEIYSLRLRPGTGRDEILKRGATR